ncbi:MAG: hypothetical protein SGPRY_007140, partial [Prymnesium sp.]
MSHVMEDAAEAAFDNSRSVGSPQWAAPEKLRGEKYDEKADTYSFGLLLYEVMARELPYKGHDSCEIIVGVITKLLPRPSLDAAMASKWPVPLQNLMVRCYAEAPHERPAFNQILDGFEELLPRDKSRSKPSVFSPSVFTSPNSHLNGGGWRGGGGGGESSTSASERASGRSPPNERQPRPPTLEELTERDSSDLSGRRLSSESRSKSAIQHVEQITPDQSEMIKQISATWSAGDRKSSDLVLRYSPSFLRSPHGQAAEDENDAAARLKMEQQVEQQLAIGIGAPQQLVVRVREVERNKEGRLVYTIKCGLDGVEWEVTRREKDVVELHTALTTLMSFVPDSPVVQRAWWRGAEQEGAAAKRLEIPITSEKRQVRELVMKDIRSHELRGLRTQMLQEIKEG